MDTPCTPRLPHVIAHRGGAVENDENTLAAICASHADGARGFEIDIRLTRDNRAVLFHDRTLDRTTDGTGRPEDFTAAGLAAVRTKKTGQPLPFLEDILDFLNAKPGTFLQIEIKSDGYPDADVARLCRTACDLVRARIDPAQVLFISFDPRALRHVSGLMPGHPTCYVSERADAETIRTARELGARQVSIRLDNISRAFANAVHDAGLQLTCWIVRNQADAWLAIVLGVDFVATDIPRAQLTQGTAHA